MEREAGEDLCPAHLRREVDQLWQWLLVAFLTLQEVQQAP